MPPEKKVWRSGVRFDSPETGELLKNDHDNYPPKEKGSCPECGGRLKLVALGDSPMVGDANWFRCLDCQELFMHRRKETVKTPPRSGFDEFTIFD